MRLTTVILIASLMQVSAAGFAQHITINQRNVSLESVLKEIRKQSGYDFYYERKDIVESPSVIVKLKDASIEQALNEVLKDLALKYTIENKTIAIVRKVPLKSDYPKIKAVNIYGKVVTSDDEPLVGATIAVKNTSLSTKTNEDGYFSLQNLKEDAILVISYIGYRTREIRINSTITKIVMEISDSKLDEVQVIAYGTTTQRYNVGSVVTVTSKDIEKQPVTNILQTLQGRVPGLLVTTTSGVPGSMTLTQIRGQNTLASAPNLQGFTQSYNQPLYVLDGVPLAMQNNPIQSPSLSNTTGASYWTYYRGLSPLSSINPLDIESISILKDADATSIYGSQGSNGVIIITTKKGKAGKQDISVTVNSGPTTASRTVEMMNIQQYLEMRKEGIRNSNSIASTSRDPDVLLFDPNKNTDWMKEFFGGTGRHTDMHLSFSGGSENTNYRVSGGYMRETYNFPGDFAENRISTHSSFTHRSKDQRFNLDFGTDLSFDKNNSSGAPSVLSAFTLPPNYPDLLNSDGKLVWNYKGFRFGNDLGNPLAYLKQIANTSVYNFNSFVQIKYRVLDGLNVGVIAGYSRVPVERYSAIPIAAQNPIYGYLGKANFWNGYTETLNIEPQINYSKTISKGTLNLVLGGTYRKNRSSSISIFANNYSTDALLTSVAAAGSPPTVNNDGSIYKYIAAFARINYLWDRKYIVNLTANRNGSSNFGPDSRYGNFGSAGIGWILTEERFLKDAVSFLSFAKLSANYGTSGSDGVQPYQYQPNWEPSSIAGGYQGFAGYNPVNPLNASYAWAVNKKSNQQLELGFFKDRLYINFSTYQDKSSNQLVVYPQPISTGFTGITANAPYTVENKGWELSVNSKNVDLKDFQWSTTFNITHNKNKLTKFDHLETSPYASTYILGQPVNVITLAPFVGVNPTTGIFQYIDAKGGLTYSPKRSSGFNGLSGDQTMMLDLNPKFTGGLGNTFSYKGISVSLFFQFAVQKGQNYLYSVYANYLTSMPGSVNVNQPTQLLARWQNPGDKSDIQRFFSGTETVTDRLSNLAAQAFGSSTGAYSDASYIRLKTASIAYDLPKNWLKKTFIDRCSIYLNGQNLFLITNYKLGDPETQSLYNIPPQRTIVAGINLNF